MTHISFRLPEALVDALAAEAKRLDVTRTTIARKALEEKLGFGKQADNGDQATPPNVDDAMAQLKAKAPERVRHTGQMTTTTGPPQSGVTEQRRKALMRAKLEKRLKNR